MIYLIAANLVLLDLAVLYVVYKAFTMPPEPSHRAVLLVSRPGDDHDEFLDPEDLAFGRALFKKPGGTSGDGGAPN